MCMWCCLLSRDIIRSELWSLKWATALLSRGIISHWREGREGEGGRGRAGGGSGEGE